MKKDTTHSIAILSFPGNNGDIENLRTFKRNGFNAFVFRWNDSLEKLHNVDGYFIGAGFSYEDRGRAGMVAARDPLFQFLHEEAERGKVIIGHCNGCQMLVESGLVPVGNKLKMCMAKNLVEDEPVGFLNEWIWITPTCDKKRCAASDWNGTMHIPIAHGEGRFVTKDPDLIAELQENDQIAFSYCTEEGNVSANAPVTPNGAMLGIAGICNKAGNVVAMMPHAERTTNGDPYFQSIHQWIDTHPATSAAISRKKASKQTVELQKHKVNGVEIFIDTKITNNEERTVEQAAKKYIPTISLKQYRYIALQKKSPLDVLSQISQFNPNKESAFIRREGSLYKWNHDTKQEEQLHDSPFLHATVLLRRDEPDTGKLSIEEGGQTGVCYACRNTDTDSLFQGSTLEVFGNPHASSLHILI